jgi:hypothetical protein
MRDGLKQDFAQANGVTSQFAARLGSNHDAS